MPLIDVYQHHFFGYKLQVWSSHLPKVLPVSLKQVTKCEVPDLYDTGKDIRKTGFRYAHAILN